MKKRIKKYAPFFSPLRNTLLISLLFFAISMIYIVASSYFAAKLSTSVLELRHIEIIKGIIFVVVISLLLFVLQYFFLRRIAQKEVEIMQHEKALLTAERRGMAGIMAASFVHDINNSLTALLLFSEDLKEYKNTNTLYEESIDGIIHEINNLKHLTYRMSNVAKIGVPGNFESMLLVEVIKNSMEISKHHKKVRQCSFQFVTNNEDILFHGNPYMIHQMMANLIFNAADATDNKGIIKIQIVKNTEQVVISVHDNGTGIPENQRQYLFNPFYTTKKEGNGLGLLSVRACVRLHNGNVEVGDSELGGAVFSVTFPLKRE